jgi:uncharacterized protein
MKIYTKTTKMPVSAEELFCWHETAGAFERLAPPWERIHLLYRDPTLKVGSQTRIELKKGLFSIQWVALHTIYDPPHEFVDIQIQGPFAEWKHYHRVHPIDIKTSKLEDFVNFRLFLGLGESIALRHIDKMFQYRHNILYNDLCMQKALPLDPMKIGITFVSGIVGTALSAFLRTAGHTVIPIEEGDLVNGGIDVHKFEDLDAVIHLAYDNTSRQTQKIGKKNNVRDSGIKGTRTLVNLLNSLQNPPQVLISASSIEFYGLNNQEPITESSFSGNSCRALFCRKWEEESNRFTKGRCVTPRFGVVLSAAGGVLEKMCRSFLMGVGGVIGSGEQTLSWIALDDLVYALYRLLGTKELSGPVNCCSPQLVTNRELTKTLGRVLRRSTICSMPRFISQIIFGKKTNEILLSSCKAKPAVLLEQEHRFYYADLEKALRHTLGRRKDP